MKNGQSLQTLAAEIERQAKTKKDYVARTDGPISMKIEAGRQDSNGANFALALRDVGDFTVGDIAHDQIATHAGIPKRYYDKMRAEAPELLVNNVAEWFERYPAPRMVRTLDGRARAFLSDSYAPLDNYDFAAATLPIIQARGLKVMSCEITEKRLYIKAVDERLFRDVPVGHKMGDGTHTIFDTVAPAVILSNSEVGFGRLVLDTGVYTRACTNLALFAKGGMKRTHVGARHRMTENVSVDDLDAIMSNETKQKTMEALWLQVRDVLAASFDEGVFSQRLEQLQAAAGNQITGKVEKVMEITAKTFDLSEKESDSIFRHLIEGGSLSQYGLHAAFTRASQDVESYDRSTEMEYMGGKIIELPQLEWRRIAEAM